MNDLIRFGDLTDSGYFGAEGGDGAETLDPAVVALVDELVAVAPAGREGLVDVLLGIQRTFDRVSWRIQELVADRFGLSPAQIAGVVGYYPDFSPEHGLAEIRATRRDRPAPAVRRSLLVLERIGVVDPDDIEHAMAMGAYGALRRALAELEPDLVIELVKRSGLQERGGAGFPVGLRWALVAGSRADTRYIVATGDSPDPGPTVDRTLLEGDPHAVIEGMVIAGYAVGARTGRLFVPSEYEVAIERLGRALEQARRKGCVGRAIMNTDFNFEIEVCESAGASMGGEETSLINRLEGRRATARPRPPFPAERGLRRRPTLIDSLETMVNIPRIVGDSGLSDCPAPGTTKVVGISIPGTEPFLIEALLGTPVRDLLEEVVDDAHLRTVRALHVGGPMGASLGPDHIDVPLDYSALRELGGFLGTGGIALFDDTVCPIAFARSLMTFCAEESCGTCPPCRIGTRAVLDSLARFEDGSADRAELERLATLCRHVAETSLCEHGRTATHPVSTGLRWIRSIYEEHLHGRGCLARG
jgi:NADH:ubiquinone oxidoreductase subunit F (NADH-binding)